MSIAQRFVVVLAVLVTVAAGSMAQTPKPKPAAAPAFPTYPEDLKFDPGTELTVEDPQTVKAGLTPTEADPANHFVIYIPKDYTPDRAFPIILFYHGVGSDPNTWPFKDITDGKGYIIIAMEYLRPSCLKSDPNYELGYVKRLITWLKSHVNVDTKMIFMTGFSMGGFHTAAICDKFADTLAGIVICSAGRGGDGPKIPAFRNMPVLITAGENEEYRKGAEATVQYFKKQQADVTYEMFKNGGHSVDTGNEVVKQWFKDNGPARQSKANFALAEKAKKDGQLGSAFTLFASIAKNPAAGDFKDKSSTAADEIAAGAKKLLDDAEKLITDRKYAEARKAFAPITVTYAGSTFAETAKQRMDYIDKDPTVAADIKQATIDAKADALEAQAQAAEAKKDFAKALGLYENYVNAYPKSHRIEQVKQRLAELKADKTITAAARAQDAERDGRANIEMANNYIKTGMPEKARPFLEDILKKYPETEWATKAKALLASIK